MALEDYYGQTCWCVKCKQCMLAYYPVMRRTCPAGERFKFLSYYAPGKMAVARYLMDGTLKYDDSVAELAYTCTLCGCCEEICQRTGPRFEPRKIIEELRAECYSRGLVYDEHKAIVDSVRNYGNVWQQPRVKRDAWSGDLDIERAVKGGAQVLYFVGCTYAYQPSIRSVARATAEVMNAAGTGFSILGSEEMCCGSPVQKVGNRELFSRIARENIKIINELGVETVVISCAGCYSTFKVDYPKEGDMDFDVVSSVEFVSELIDEGRLNLREDGEGIVVTYHDPCHLGRRSAPPDGVPSFMSSLGIYDAPRRLLEAIPAVELREMERIREYTWCCGAGGGLKSAFPEVALWSAQQRIKEAKDTGAGALVTACPWCETNLAAATAGDDVEMEILDVVTMVREAMV